MPSRAAATLVASCRVLGSAAPPPPDEVTVVDLVRVFAPGGRLRASIDGRVDGLHLDVAGWARLLMRRLRAGGFI